MYSSVTVYKQQCSYLHDGHKNLYRYVFHENWAINIKVIIEITYVIILQKVSQACIICKWWYQLL